MRPSDSQIAEVAYGLWEQRGCVHGRDVEHWLEAEAILRGPGSYDVTLTDPGDDEVQVLRTIREATGLDLKTVRTLVHKTPRPLGKNMPKKDAEALVTALRKVGAAAELTRCS